MNQQTGKATPKIDGISRKNVRVQHHSSSERSFSPRAFSHSADPQSMTKQRSDRTGVMLLIMLVMILSAALIGIL